MNDFQEGTVKYFSSARSRLKTLRDAELYLDYIFDIHLTLSDRMELRHHVSSMIEQACQVTHPANYQQPEQSGTAKFLMIHYPTLDRQLIARAIVNRYPIARLNRQIKELRDS